MPLKIQHKWQHWLHEIFVSHNRKSKSTRKKRRAEIKSNKKENSSLLSFWSPLFFRGAFDTISDSLFLFQLSNVFMQWAFFNAIIVVVLVIAIMVLSHSSNWLFSWLWLCFSNIFFPKHVFYVLRSFSFAQPLSWEASFVLSRV